MKIAYLHRSSFSVHDTRLSHKARSESRGALAERHTRAAVRDDLATDDMRATDEMLVFGTHPQNRSSGLAEASRDSLRPEQ
jgi:hypothetical protein